MILLIVGLYMLALAVLGLLCLRLMTVLHEGGHLLAALVLFPGPITVYLGSYGQPTGSGTLRLGRVQVHIKLNLLKWRGGYCEYQQPLGTARWRQAVLLVAGSVVPLLLAVVGFYLSFSHHNGLLRFVAAVFLLFIVLGLLNLVPRSKPIMLPDGRQTYNDGTLLRQLLRRQPPAGPQLDQQLTQADAYLRAGQYAASAGLLATVLTQVVPTADLLRYTIQAHSLAGHYDEALHLGRQLAQDFTAQLTDADRHTYGHLLSLTNQHELALAAYTELIEQPTPYLLAYSNRGYTYNVLGDYALALADFDHVLVHTPQDAYARSCRGRALCKLGHVAAGLAELQAGLQADASNSYLHLNLGIYYFDQGEYTAALACFEQAHQHNSATHSLANYLQQTRQHLAEASGTSG